MSNTQQEAKRRIIDKIEELQQQIRDISAEIELDRKENGEDDASIRNDLIDRKNFLENSINELMATMNKIDVKSDRVGQTLELSINGNSRKFTIVFAGEADISKGLLSVESPLAQAVKDSKPGDVVDVETPNGTQKYKVISIKK